MTRQGSHHLFGAGVGPGRLALGQRNLRHLAREEQHDGPGPIRVLQLHLAARGPGAGRRLHRQAELPRADVVRDGIARGLDSHGL